MTRDYQAETAASITGLARRIMETNLCKEIMLTANYEMCTLTEMAHRIKPKPKYQFSRAKWYVADFKWQDQHRAFEWCNQQFGVHPERPDAWSRWKTMPGNQFAFRDQKDYNWFVLRWS